MLRTCGCLAPKLFVHPVGLLDPPLKCKASADPVGLSDLLLIFGKAFVDPLFLSIRCLAFCKTRVGSVLILWPKVEACVESELVLELWPEAYVVPGVGMELWPEA